MLTSKQRAFLRSLAMNEDTILMIGKGGMSDPIIKQAHDALTARELIKGKVLETADLTPREAAERIALETGTCMISSDIFVDDYARSRGVFFPIENYENHRHFYACSMASKSLPGYARDLIDICRKVIQQIKNGGYTE